MAREAKGAKATIIEAFNRLILSGGEKPPVADILDEAGVARSTFYEHFNGRDSLFLEAFEGPLSVIVDAATRDGDDARLTAILEHLRDYRRGAVDMLTGPMAPRIARALASLVAARVPGATQKSSLHLADMQLGFIRLWLTGETPYAAADLARLMIRSAAVQRAVLSGGMTS